MSNLPASERQGYLGELASKSTSELQNLLARQQIIIANAKFVNSLPDRGDKIRKMIENLEKALKQREHVDNTADLFEKMALDAEHCSRNRTQKVPTVDDVDEDTLGQIINVDTSEKIVYDERESSKVHTTSTRKEELPYSYQRVIKEREGDVSQKEKYLPHRSIRTKDVQNLPSTLLPQNPQSEQPENDSSTGADVSMEAMQESELPGNSGSQSQETTKTARTLKQQNVTSDPSRKLKFRYDECLERAVDESQKTNTSSKIISIEDSLELMKEQKRKLEELQAKQAAEKLAQKLNISMATYDPEGSRRMAYRDAGQEQDVDVDDGDRDSDDDLDYPD